jgi:molybdopterin adenylyltransferase
MSYDTIKIGLLSISDRASAGIYKDEGLPSLEAWLRRALHNPITIVSKVIPDEQPIIEATLRAWADDEACATLAVADRVMDGFGERMRQISLRFVPTAILSRQVAVIRKSSLIVNLPGQPKAIQEILEGLRNADGVHVEPGIMAAIPYCVDLIGGPYIETVDEVIKAFRPKSAQRPPGSGPKPTP